LAIASLGRQNRFGFPHPQVLDRLREGGSPLLRTDRDGTIQVEITDDGQLQHSLGLEPVTLWRYLGLR
jgi:competence protein ComEC